MIALLNHVTAMTLAASDGDGAPVWLLALGPAGAAGLYFGLWSYYRNTGKSHSFEHETRVAAKPITGNETKVNRVTGTKATRINGDNVSDYRQRVQRLG
jgi:hypothetical protein